MAVFSNKTFDGWKEYDSPRRHNALRFVNCTFQSCSIALTAQDLSNRARVSDAEFRKCNVSACGITAAIIEDVLVDELKTSGLFQTWATVFKHVTLKGKIDRVMFSPFFHPGYPVSTFQRIIGEANAAYYAGVDWALDIREAEFKDFDCRGVPSHLVRRDPETQVMVTRQQVLACGPEIAAGGPYWEGWLKLFLQDGWYQDAVLVAPKRSPKLKELIAGLAQLRRQGVAVAD